MRHLQSVVWSKGVFLTPQHLQAQDHFFEESFRFLLTSLSSCSWGLSVLAFDLAGLNDGRLQITDMQGLFPDGLAFDTTAIDLPPGSRMLDECFTVEQKSCMFYLAVPQHRHGGINVALKGGNGSGARFRSEIRMMRDESGSGIEKPVALARKNFEILAEGEDLEGMVTLPVARVVRTEAGTFAFDQDFIPPMLNVHANERLRGVLRGLVEVISSRSAQLAGSRRQRNQSLADFSASDVARFWLLYTMNTNLPVLLELFRAPYVHPETLYARMLSLGGALTTFSHTAGPLDFPRYEHKAMGECFLKLGSQILALLDTVIPTRFIALPLRRATDSVYIAEIEKDEYLSGAAYVAIAADISSAELIERTPALVKVCSATHLETLIRQALPGVPLTHMAAPPQAIPVKLNYQYFSLDRSGAAWETILRSRNFGMYVPGDIANASMELILVPAEASASRAG
ncbi:type VI secretion system protein ImpJ [Granulicella aggregans]|uniref:Type VI secretion system protein ImpJ n=1 Tax=Granulicella aggregans TaxID=474949 RepID=A0A7W7ZIB3_9BACT|nr:type VI secretion system baseplate subunit TssK [Granulicella aggregans]MBB5060372.1 type VI secretion system protein ImpJ [Granulicella aggregans]